MVYTGWNYMENINYTYSIKKPLGHTQELVGQNATCKAYLVNFLYIGEQFGFIKDGRGISEREIFVEQGFH